jgi:hypothetical protein
MPTVTLKADKTKARGSGAVTSGNTHIIEFPSQTKIVGFMAKASTGNTMKIRYTIDGDSVPILWVDWSHGDADDTRVYEAAFQGGLHQFEISGDGNYSYAWD